MKTEPDWFRSWLFLFKSKRIAAFCISYLFLMDFNESTCLTISYAPFFILRTCQLMNLSSRYCDVRSLWADSLHVSVYFNELKSEVIQKCCSNQSVPNGPFFLFLILHFCNQRFDDRSSLWTAVSFNSSVVWRLNCFKLKEIQWCYWCSVNRSTLFDVRWSNWRVNWTFFAWCLYR